MRLRRIALLLALAGCNDVFGLARPTDAAEDGGPNDDAPPPCRGASCLEVLATGETDAAEIAVAGDDVVWTIDRAVGAVRGCLISQCTPSSLTPSEVSPHSPWIDDNFVLWATGTHIVHLPRQGTNGERMTIVDDSATIRAFRRAGGRLYRAGASLAHCPFDPVTGTCGTSVVVTTSGLEDLDRPFAADSAGRLWASHRNRIVRIDGDARDKHFSADDVITVAPTETHVFAVESGSEDVRRWPYTATDASDGNAIPVGGAPRTLAADSARLYVGDATGRILAIPLVEPWTPFVVAEMLPAIRAIAQAGDHIYVVTTDGQIARLPKP